MTTAAAFAERVICALIYGCVQPCPARDGETNGACAEEAGRAALLHAMAEDYPRIHAELRRIAAGCLDFGPPLKGAA